MEEIVVVDRQTLIDIAIQYLGDATGVITLAKLNNISITQDLIPGQKLWVNKDLVINERVVNYLKEKNSTPITF